jgi:hypothetical protein
MTQNQSSDTVLFLGVGIALLAGWALWHFFHQPITEGFRWIRHGELWAIAKLVPDDNLAKWVAYLGDRRTSVQWSTIKMASSVVGHYLRYPTAIFLLILTYFAVFRAPRGNFKKTYTLDRLIAAQARIWPVITPIVDFNPAEDNARDPDSREAIPADLPVFAEALSPEEWLRWHKIVPYDTIDHEHTSDPAIGPPLAHAHDAALACPRSICRFRPEGGAAAG